MIWQAQCYPTDVDDLKPVLDLVAKLGADHVNLQPNVRPQRIEACIPLLEGWRRLGEQAGVAVHVETHRDRMTTDLFFTLQLLDCFPDLRLTADVSHYLVGREFAWPVDDINHAMIHRILDNSWGIHGRIASREQVQVSLGFPQHQGWVDLFMGWWEYAIRSWRKRAGPDAVLTFLCELGPPPYAITGPDGGGVVGSLAGCAANEGHDRRAMAAYRGGRRPSAMNPYLAMDVYRPQFQTGPIGVWVQHGPKLPPL